MEVLLETGVMGGVIVLWFLIAVYREGMRNLAGEKNGQMVTAAALAGCTGLLAHSFLDFNLHMPANAAIFFVLCALAASRETA
jgi:O-antigen ligase